MKYLSVILLLFAFFTTPSAFFAPGFAPARAMMNNDQEQVPNHVTDDLGSSSQSSSEKPFEMYQEKEVIEMMKDVTSYMRPCPKCHLPAMKDSNSNPVRCPQGHEFHFVRGLPPKSGTPNFVIWHDFNPRDESGEEILPPRTYRVAFDADYVPGMEYSDYVPTKTAEEPETLFE